MDIYQQNILDHYKNPRNFGTLDDPTKTSRGSNPSCGDKIAIDVIIEDKKIKDIKFTGEGCAISTAAASMLTEEIKGKDLKHITSLKFEDIKKMLGIEISTGRIKCATLALNVIKKTISK